MIWKTIKWVIWDATTPFYISMEDGSVYHMFQHGDPYEDFKRISYEKVRDISDIEIYYQLDLGIITDEEFEVLKEKELEELDKQSKDRTEKLNKFRNLVNDLEISLGKDTMKLLRDCKHLL